MSFIGFYFFIIMARIIVATISFPVLFQYLLDRFISGSQYVQPVKYGPDTVLFANMIGAGAETFLTAKRGFIGIEQGTEEFPSSGCFVAWNTQLCCNFVRCRARRHRPRDSRQSIFVGGN